VTLRPGEADNSNNFIGSNKGMILGNVKSDKGEPGVTVRLLDADRTVIGTTTTDTDGNYKFGRTVKNSQGSHPGEHTSGRRQQYHSSGPYHPRYEREDDRTPHGRDSDRRSRGAELALRTGEASSNSVMS